MAISPGTPLELRQPAASTELKCDHVHFRFRHQAPDRHHVVMLALVVFGLFALVLLETDEFPDVAAAGRRRRRSPIRAPRPTASSARSSSRSRKAIAGISGVDKIQSNVARRLRA